MNRQFLALISFLVWVSEGFCQISDSIPLEMSNRMEYLVEDISSQYEEGTDPTEVLIEYNHFGGNKIDLNAMDPFCLEQILQINAHQAEHLAAYIQHYGPLLSVYELQVIEGFDSATIHRILPLIRLVQPVSKTHIHPLPWKNRWSGSLMFRYGRILEPQAGYQGTDDTSGSANRYLGDPSRIWVRWHAKMNDRISIGLTAEKDPGEQFFTGTQKQGFDHYSTFLMVHGTRTLKTIIIGDYHVGFGQGLTINTTGLITMGKGLYQPYKFANPLRPNASSNEIYGLRGAAICLKTGKFEWSLFSSAKRTDARYQDHDTLDHPIPVLVNLVSTGYHRTRSEMETRDVVRNLLLGSHVTYRNHFLQAGITCYHTRFDVYFMPSEEIYKRFGQVDNKSTIAGLDFRVLLPHVVVFGEMSYPHGRTPGFLMGLWWYSQARFKYSVVYRHYPVGFLSPSGSAAGKNQQNNNETGFFTAMEALLSRKISITAGADIYWKPWVSYRLDKPSAGSVIYIITDYKSGPHFRWILKYQCRSAEQNATDPSHTMHNITESYSHQMAIQCMFTPLPFLTLKQQVYFSKVQQEKGHGERGYLISLDIHYISSSRPWDVMMRYAVFDTDGYNARIYAYERDVLYVYSAPAYYSKGIRIMGMIRFGFLRRTDLWLRYALSFYSDQSTVGSGLDEIASAHRSEIKIQLRYRL